MGCSEGAHRPDGDWLQSTWRACLAMFTVAFASWANALARRTTLVACSSHAKKASSNHALQDHTRDAA